MTKNYLKAAFKMTKPISQERIKDLIEENNQLKIKDAKSIKEKTVLKIKISELKIENQTYRKKISALQKTLDKTKSDGGDIIIHYAPSKLSSNQYKK